MNKTLRVRVGAGLVAVFLLGSFGVATAAVPPAPAQAGSTIEQRIVQRKAERGIVLNEVDQKRLTDTCVPAQAKLRLIQHDAVSRLERHSKIYKRIDGRLWLTTGQLKLAIQDTFQLEKQRLALVDKTANFETLVTNYEQVLDDSLVINCKADPAGFKALLDTTRAYYDLLRSQSVDIHDYVVNTIKPTMANHVSLLQPKAAPEEGR